MKDTKLPSRKSQMEFGKVYFWTNTVKGWKKIFTHDPYRQILISSLNKLISRKTISVYSFVIMPNHLHVIWELIEPNEKEMPNASFNKFTSHMISKNLKSRDKELHFF